MSRLLADGHLSRHFMKACERLQPGFPVLHIADWRDGVHRNEDDPVLLSLLREDQLILVSFDLKTMAMHAGELTRAGLGHAGVILFRNSISQMDYGKQSRILLEFWKTAFEWDWVDRIVYLPR